MGFLTIVFFLAALGGGGWFWLFFLISLGAWISKYADGQSTEKKTPPPRESLPSKVLPPSPISSVPTPVLPEEYVSKDWEVQLTEICSRYSGTGFYVAELIPQDKLENAREVYLIPGYGLVIALIDATIFGSAKNGMAICTKGISWHNIAETKPESMTWSEFSEVRTIGLNNNNVFMVRGIPGVSREFKMAASGFDKNKAVELLKAIQLGYSQREGLQSETRLNPSEKVVDIVSASYEELLALPGIGAAEANILLKHNESEKNLQSIDEMADLLNLKPHIVERLKGRVSFSESKRQTHVPVSPATPATPTPPSKPNVPGRGRTID